MNNQRGGFLSKVFVIPAGVALMVGFFFLGYFVGKYQARQPASGDKPDTLPEIASQYLPKKEDLTFYKTLTDREDKTVSIDIQSRQKTEGHSPAASARASENGREAATQKTTEKQLEIKIDRTVPPQKKQSEAKAKTAQSKSETVIASTHPAVGRFTVQIASYPDRNSADEEMKRMKKRGYAAFVVSSELPDKGTWYRVRLGSFAKKEAAEKLAKELRVKEGLTPMVTLE